MASVTDRIRVLSELRIQRSRRCGLGSADAASGVQRSVAA